ncbi:cysteine hydrolase family protein [Nocardioides sp. YIM 152588]|uniref:cysteine hydrolase family protein n=1 Tax=Nocardioides sp. YIM 152588 TaxID=3158259 RepID=UPI0032E3FE4A
MSAFADRPETALLVIDVQNDVVAGAPRRDEVVAAIGRLVDRARDAGTPVVWVQHSSDHLVAGTDGWAYVPELVRAATEPIVHKRYGDSFEDTGLEDVLAGLGVGHVLVTGAQSDFCVRSTLHGALVRGYDVTLVADAHTTEDLREYGAPAPEEVVAHTNMYWSQQKAPGRVATVVPASEVVLAPVGAGA